MERPPDPLPQVATAAMCLLVAITVAPVVRAVNLGLEQITYGSLAGPAYEVRHARACPPPAQDVAFTSHVPTR